MNDQPASLTAVLDLLEKLDAANIYYRLSAPTERAIMVEIAIPDERWEVEFLESGEVRTEQFVSNGDTGIEALEDMFTRVSDS